MMERRREGQPWAAAVTTVSPGDHGEWRPQAGEADGPPFRALQSGPCDFTLSV